MMEFESKLLEIIEERETILFEIERSLFTKRYNLSRKHIEIFSVQSISMIYSIWEGFIQKAFQLYIDEINKTEINIFSYSDEIIIHHMENSFKQLREYPNKNIKKIDYFNKLNHFYRQDKHIIYRLIDTESNVSFEVLNQLLKTFSLETFPEFWHIYSYPQPNLKETMFQFLRLRNTVAHGGDLDVEDKVTHTVFQKYKTLTINLMYEIRLKMIYGLTHITFQKN